MTAPARGCRPVPTKGTMAICLAPASRLGRACVTLVGVWTLVAAGSAAANETAAVPPPGHWAHQPVLEASLIAEINRVRTARRIPALVRTPILRRPARAHSRYLALVRRGRLTHRDARGRPFHRRLVDAGWRARARMSENLASINACRLRDPRLIVRRWFASPRHRANLLDRKVTHVGVGVVSTGRCGMTVYTANFGN